jgi:hypothetical protein
MRGQTLWAAGLVAAGLTLAPAAARAQDPGLFPDSRQLFPDALSVRAQTPDGELPDYEVPVPLGHNPANKGGFYMGASFVYYRQTNPLEHQPIGFRGFIDADGSVTGTPGTLVGSGTLALDAKMAGGPGTYSPGLRTDLGYAWKDGTTISLGWLHLEDVKLFHEATIVPPLFNFGPTLADSFLFSPVFNFTNIFAGPQNKIATGAPTATFGIWDGADIMTIQFIQRYEQIEATLKTPIFYNDDFGYRMYGIIGPRFAWIWERFLWRTVNQDPSGNAGPTDIAIYTNIVSNRLYGVHTGVGNEWYIGHGFACNLDLECAGFLDAVKERAKYELGDKFQPGQIKRAVSQYTVVPEFEARLNLTWFPLENFEIKLGYNFMSFANTIAAPHPVSFDVGALDPAWEHRWRFYDGWEAGVGIIF